MGYPKGFLETRAVIIPGSYAVIPPEGRVINSIPGFEGCRLSIICSPKIGASFVQYVGTVDAGGKTTSPFVADPGVESFIYVMDGDGALKVTVGDQTETLKPGGYAFAPPDDGIEFLNESGARYGSCSTSSASCPSATSSRGGCSGMPRPSRRTSTTTWRTFSCRTSCLMIWPST
jgi:glyoxylate utilization-related uncharacterized protein